PFERPLGASPEGIRVWAPKAQHVAVRLGGEDHPLEPEGLGTWSGAPPWQPKGLRGPSRLVDPGAWTWTDRRWRGIRLRDLVLLELHVGTFTPAGTFDAAIGELARLRDLGITAIELLPIAAFPGERGWGYDGVHPWSAQ